MSSYDNCMIIADHLDEYIVKAKIEYGSERKNNKYAVYTPLKRKCPKFINFTPMDYSTGSISVRIVGDDFLKNRELNREELTKYAEDFSNFLSKNTLKIIKDWNNVIRLVVFKEVSITYDSNYGNMVAFVSAQWTEEMASTDYGWWNKYTV